MDHASFGISELNQLLGSWSRRGGDELLSSPPPPENEGTFTRIHQILSEFASADGSQFPHDLPPLLRQALFSENQLQRSMSVPRGNDWPDDHRYWEGFGFTVIDAGAEFIVRPKTWMPEWLGSTSENREVDLFEECYSGLKYREAKPVPADPFYSDLTGFCTYLSIGQREAVRGALLMKPGSTLIVNLPTGSGKSIAGKIHVLLRGLNDGLTLFIVPTTALALDLERRTKTMLREYRGVPADELAWYGGLTPGVKTDITQRIRNGTQGILFCSPEAVTGSLLPALYDAVEKHYLKYFVIDEAHIVAQWGAGFRPEFQGLAGVRRGLMRHSEGEALRTILMSATMSEETISTLKTLFGSPEATDIVASVSLRPEPRYFVHQASDQPEKEACVLEAIKHAPRPFILYVTERKHANSWLEKLKSEGYQRTASFHGGTPDTDRIRVLEDWDKNRLDGIVANSAFGLGVDKRDVRSVIHATVPETLDRFYQEVGRGGRDGKASVSVTVYTNEDVVTARQQNNPKSITTEVGFPRWESMHSASQQLGNGFLRIDLRDVNPSLDQESSRNTQWNRRTLTLMVRAGFIDFDSVKPPIPSREPNEDELDFESRRQDAWHEFRGSMVIRITDWSHLNESHFEDKIEAQRSRETEVARKSLDTLLSVFTGECEMSNALRSTYEIRNEGVYVAQVCRGCPAGDQGKAMEAHARRYREETPTRIKAVEEHPKFADRWRTDFFASSSRLVILFPDTFSSLVQLKPCLELLVAIYGVREIVMDGRESLNSSFLSNLHKSSHDKILYLSEGHFGSGVDSPPVRRATILWDKATQKISDEIVPLVERPPEVVLARESIGSDHPDRTYRQQDADAMELDMFMGMARR